MNSEKMCSNQTHNQGTVSGLDEESFSVEMAGGSEHFGQVLLEAVEEAFSSLGVPVEQKIFCTLEKTFGIRRSEVPHRIEDFSDAIEKIFGLGAVQLEILVKKRFRKKVLAEYKWDAPEWVVKELTFSEYINMVKRNLSNPAENLERHPRTESKKRAQK
jgi:hypothetical protein